MRRPALKALFALLSQSRDGAARPQWERIVIAASTAVTIGLVVLYAYGKATGRW